MKRLILGFLFLFLVSFMSLDAQWARTYGGDEDDKAYSIQQTSDGGYIIAGNSKSFGSGEKDIWVFKTDNDGIIEWQKIYPWGVDADAYSAQQTSDGGYVVLGSSKYSIWISKLDSAGSIEWEKTYTHYWGASARSIYKTDDNGYIVAGHMSTSLGEYTLILKLSSSGEIEWDYYYQGYDNGSYSIQQTSDGGYIAAGHVYELQRNAVDLLVLRLNSDGSFYWAKKYGAYRKHAYANSIQPTSDGGYIVGGYTISWDEGDKDALILKLSHTGEIEGYRSYSGLLNSEEEVLSIQQTSDGGYVYLGKYPHWISKLSSSRSEEWSKKFNDCILKSIQQTSDGGYIVSGYYYGNETNEVVVLKLDSEGNISASCELIEDFSPWIGGTSLTRYGEVQRAVSAQCETGYGSVVPQDTDAAVSLICSIQEYTLTISATPGGTTNPVPGTYTHDYGTQVQVTAVPDSGYQFSGWTGAATGTTNPIAITMDADKTITATFSSTQTGGDGDGGGKKGGCFIATAAYGSPLHPHLDILRDFRDKYLIPSKFGQRLAKLYYKNSPLVAEIIAKHKLLKVAVRISLIPLVAFSYSMLHFGPIITGVILLLIFTLPIFLGWFFWKISR